MTDTEFEWIDSDYLAEIEEEEMIEEEMELAELEMIAEEMYEGVRQEMTLAQIRAVRSFFAQGNSATFLKSLSEEGTLANLSKQKLNMQLSLAPSNLLSQSSSTSQESGKETVMKNDSLEFPSQE